VRVSRDSEACAIANDDDDDVMIMIKQMRVARQV